MSQLFIKINIVMQTITIYIRNMVCPRCIHVVKQILTEMGISFSEVDLGFATLKTIDLLDFDRLNDSLEQLGLGLIRDQNEQTIADINRVVHFYFDNINKLSRQYKLSEYIAQELGKNYHQLSKLYSQSYGTTIEQYFIDLRTTKVKELIKQGDLNLSQIAITVGYSSIHYLSGQFKKYSGMSLSEYRKKWEEEVKESFEKENLQRHQKECNCGCECEDCECEEEKTSGKNVQVGPSNIFDGRINGESRLNVIPKEFREFRAFVSL